LIGLIFKSTNQPINQQSMNHSTPRPQEFLNQVGNNRHFPYLCVLCLVIVILPACRTTPQPPAFSSTLLGSVQKDILYCKPDDKPQYMDIYYPDSGGPWPVVLFVHGGGWQQGDKAGGEYMQFLNDHGILLASINYRLSDEGEFPIMIEDAKCAVRYLRTYSAELNIDPDRIGAAGWSAGGHLAALLGLAQPGAGWDDGEFAGQSSQVQAVAAKSGIHDFTVSMPEVLNTVIIEAFGTSAGNSSPENLNASPVTYITPDAPPFLIVHGEVDDLVPVEQSEILHARLTEAGVPATLIIVQGGDHGLQGEAATPSQPEIWQAVGEFFESSLK
jgi:acetyl esterase/lipase